MEKPWYKRWWVWLILIFGGFYMFVYVFVDIAPTAVTDKQEQRIATPTPTPKPEYFSTNARKFFDSMDDMTELQREEYWKKAEGKTVRWKLYVYEVESAILSDYKVTCSPALISLSSVTIRFDGEQNLKVLTSLKRGQHITVEGKLDSYSDFISVSVSLTDCTIK